MCQVVNYIYRCNHAHRATEPCSHASAGYACSGRQAEKHLALSDTCPTCAPAYQKWLQLQALGSDKQKRAMEQEETRKLNEWARLTLFEAQ